MDILNFWRKFSFTKNIHHHYYSAVKIMSNQRYLNVLIDEIRG